MTIRTLLLLATAVLTAATTVAAAQDARDTIAAPVLRANVTVTGDIVRIGDVIDNAGPAAQIAIYRAPDLGTTGALPTAQVLTALRAHQVIGGGTLGSSSKGIRDTCSEPTGVHGQRPEEPPGRSQSTHSSDEAG